MYNGAVSRSGIKDTTVHFPVVGYDKHDNVGVSEIVSYRI